jgi:hypothetical protein
LPLPKAIVDQKAEVSASVWSVQLIPSDEVAMRLLVSAAKATNLPLPKVIDTQVALDAKNLGVQVVPSVEVKALFEA